MKKCRRLSHLLLTASLLFTLLAPAALATETEFEPINAKSAILIDSDYDEVLYEQDADERRYPASITKVMTALLTMEAIERGELSMDTAVTLTDELYTGIGEGGSTQDLKPGEILTVRDLLNCVLIPSANEACNALAVLIGGTIPDFVERMNQRAQELRMENTHFANTHGYHDDDHYTTARDISRMCLEAMKHPDFREIVSSVSYTVPATNLHEQRVLHDTNALISNFRTGRGDLLYRYATGIKTGSTPEAGYCLASAAEKNGRTVIAVVLGGENYKTADANYFSESKRLLEHGFNDFSRMDILSEIEPIETIPVNLCSEQNYVTVQPANSLSATLPSDTDLSSFERTVELPETLEAPIEKGQVVGKLHLTQNGQEYGTVDLVASSALERSQLLYILDRVQTFFSQLWVKLAIVVLVVALAALLIHRRNLRRRKRRRRYQTASSGGYRGGRWR